MTAEQTLFEETTALSSLLTSQYENSMRFDVTTSCPDPGPVSNVVSCASPCSFFFIFFL